ncbi:MAG TPA: SMI1/KNR4 family protein [Kofleriaceae bacterium]|nr:SMI1/KNR4 family protein [Kofleriaceae bacterium]
MAVAKRARTSTRTARPKQNKPASKKPTLAAAKKRKVKPKLSRRAGAQPKAKAKAKAKATPKPKAKPRPSPKAGSRRTPRARATRPPEPEYVEYVEPSDAIPQPMIVSPTGAVVQIVDSSHPIEALRRFLDGITGPITTRDGQIILGSAQLMLLPIAREHRGGDEVKQLLDLVLGRWHALPDTTGFHARELLRNAFAAVGNDPDRIARLMSIVPEDASAELLFNIACAYAVAGDRAAMLRAVDAALDAGASPNAFAREPDFLTYRDDPELRALLERSTAPAIPVDVDPHLPAIRNAVESVVRTLREFGEIAHLEPPASLDTILAAERAARIQLPNDYRALLTICDGMKLFDHQFFGTLDYRSDTRLARSAREYLESSSRSSGMEDCVPLASWGRPNEWLLYDPHGRIRGGEPGVVLVLAADERPLDGVVGALESFEAYARDMMGTN